MDVSIIITTYNYARFIDECISSCINQINCELDYEILIIDDGSTDNTQKVISKYQNKNIKIFKLLNSGIEYACNFAFKQASGNYLIRVDADDKLRENFLTVIKEYLYNDTGFVYSNYSIIDSDSVEVGTMKLPSFKKEEIFNRGDFLATGTVFNSSIIQKNCGYSTAIINSGLENYELILDLISQGIEGKQINQDLFFYRQHKDNISLKNRQKIIENGQKLFKKKKYGIFKTNEYHPFGLKV